MAYYCLFILSAFAIKDTTSWRTTTGPATSPRSSASSRYGLSASHVAKLNDQHAYLVLGGDDRVDVGDWIEFGISHPCTVFDKWQMIPVLDDDGRVVDLVRTFF